MTDAEWVELEIWRAIEKAHGEGMNYWEILRLMPHIIEGLIMKADTEYWLKQGK